MPDGGFFSGVGNFVNGIINPGPGTDASGAPKPVDQTNPANYDPGPAVHAVAPVAAALAGGNPGNTLNNVQQANTTDKDVMSGITDSITRAASQLSAAFNAGMSAAKPSGANPGKIAADASAIGTAASTATLAAGIGAANVAREDALHKAAAAMDLNKEIVQAQINPGSPQVVQQATNIGETAKQVDALSQQMNEYTKVGFFDNPGAYLLNRVIRIPYTQGRLEDTLGTLKGESDLADRQAKFVTDRSAVDTAFNSVDTTTRAANLYLQKLGEATAAGFDPLMKSKQLELGGYNLGVAQGELGVAQMNANTSRGFLALGQAKLPGELQEQSLRTQALQNELTMQPLKIAGQQMMNEYYQTGKENQLLEIKAKTADLQSRAETNLRKGIQDQSMLDTANAAVKAFGGQGTISDLNKVGPTRANALLQIGNNINQFGSPGVPGEPATNIDLIQKAGIPVGADNVPASWLPAYNALLKMKTEGEIVAGTPSTANGFKPLTGNDRLQAVDQYMNNKLINSQTVTGWSPNDPIFTIPSVNTVIEQDWAKNNPLLQAMRPLAVDGTGSAVARPMDGSLLMNTAAQQVADGKMTAEQATDFLYQAAKGIQDSVQKAGGFKARGVPVLDQFTTGYQREGAFGNPHDKVNLFNKGDTLQKLRAQIGAIKSTQQLSQPSFLAPGGTLP